MTNPSEHPYQWAVVGPPIGMWKVAFPASIPMTVELCFAEDGTGWEDYGTFMSPPEVRTFQWRLAAPGYLRILDTTIDADGEQPPGDPDDWGHVRYCADWLETDRGTVPILRHPDFDSWLGLPGAISLVDRQPGRRPV